MKEQEVKGLLSNLGIKTQFSKISLLDILFYEVEWNCELVFIGWW